MSEILAGGYESLRQNILNRWRYTELRDESNKIVLHMQSNDPRCSWTNDKESQTLERVIQISGSDEDITLPFNVSACGIFEASTFDKCCAFERFTSCTLIAPTDTLLIRFRVDVPNLGIDIGDEPDVWLFDEAEDIVKDLTFNPISQDNYNSPELIKGHVQHILNGLDLTDIDASIVDDEYTEPVKGNSDNIDGINGMYAFSVLLTKSVSSAPSSIERKLGPFVVTIEASMYDGGTMDYTKLRNIPSINDVALVGNKGLDELGLRNMSDDDILEAFDLDKRG